MVEKKYDLLIEKNININLYAILKKTKFIY